MMWINGSFFKSIIISIIGWLIVFNPHLFFGQESIQTVTTKKSFDDYRKLINKNIFDPNRLPPQPDNYQPDKSEIDNSQENQDTSNEPTFVPETIALVGTFIDGPTAVAFFNSSTDEYKKVEKLGQTIAGFTIEKINTEFIHLKRDTSGVRLEFPVGSTIQSQPDGTWKMTAGTKMTSATTTVSLQSSPQGLGQSAEIAPKSSPAASEPSDILKKLMERRRKERGQ